MKSDNAEVPILFWNNALARKLGLLNGKLSPAQERAADTLRNFFVNKLWKRNVTLDFCRYIRCKPCYRIANKARWRGITVGTVNTSSTLEVEESEASAVGAGRAVGAMCAV